MEQVQDDKDETRATKNENNEVPNAWDDFLINAVVKVERIHKYAHLSGRVLCRGLQRGERLKNVGMTVLL